jgi:hypothetical protein
LNVTKDRQARAKFTYISVDGKEFPYDIVVYEFTTPKVSVMDMAITFFVSGEEHAMHIPISLKVNFHLLSREWTVSGDIDWQPFTVKFKSISDIPPIMEQVKHLFFKNQ